MGTSYPSPQICNTILVLVTAFKVIENQEIVSKTLLPFALLQLL